MHNKVLHFSDNKGNTYRFLKTGSQVVKKAGRIFAFSRQDRVKKGREAMVVLYEVPHSMVAVVIYSTGLQ